MAPYKGAVEHTVPKPEMKLSNNPVRIKGLASFREL
jgi:hypothetical protein